MLSKPSRKTLRWPNSSERVTVEGRDVMRYAQPVRVAQDCLQCHGDPAGSKDPFGYAKEGMKTGELRAAFVLEAPTATLVQNSKANMLATFLTSFLTVIAAIVVVYVVTRASPSGPFVPVLTSPPGLPIGIYGGRHGYAVSG